jgi:ubiquinone/menaquinone biosynthesis C-methylase UbiE
VAERVDFSENAPIYDRRHGAGLSHLEASRLFQAARLRAGTRLLDIGAGTGRVAIPMAELGCDVVALEPASGMVKELRAKSPHSILSVVVGEGARLPFVTASFGAVVIARLLYLTPDWREILTEVRRVLEPGGWLLHERGNGQSDEPWVQVRDEARRLFESVGVANPFHPGVRSEADLLRYLEQLRFVRSGTESFGAGPVTTLGEFLQRIVEGEVSYIWAVPADVQAKCLPSLVRWAEQRFDLKEPMAMPLALQWSLYRKDDA